jgi:membrane associated rhomboid family serine protease
MFVLFVLGRIVESSLGGIRLIAGFFIGGVLSSAAVLAAMEWGWTDQAVLIGASGGIFALFGIEVATQVSAWLRTRDILDWQRVILLAIIMVMQLVVDLTMPEISLTAHLSGFAIGLLLGAVFNALPPRKATNSSA